MKEKTVLLGRSKNLVAIVTNPDATFDVRQRPAIILLNSGLLHRVGPNRIYVKIARTLAAEGFVVLRFDLSGIGDSPVPSDSETYDETTGIIMDTQDVMDYLSETQGIERFILMGLCSGASNAFRVACHDKRVVGVNLIEGFAFPSTAYYVQAYGKSVLSLKSWWRLLTGKSEVWGLIRGLVKFHTSQKTRQLTENLHVPEKDLLLADLEGLIKRKVRLCFIYAATSSAYHNYREIFAEKMKSLAESQRPRLEILHDTDHLFTLLHHQEALLKLIQDWVQHVELHEVSERV